MQPSWRMTVYDLRIAGHATVEGGSERFFYLREGHACADSDHALPLEADHGFFSRETTKFEGEGTLWVYEMAPFGTPLLPSPDALVVLSRRFERESGPPLLLRADRIESPPGAATPRHTHRGPGVRRLLYGRLLAEMGDDLQLIEPGQAWFETGKDPIVGTNISPGDSSFVRMMVLPIELEGGKSSFVASSSEEARKPRAVTNSLFGEASRLPVMSSGAGRPSPASSRMDESVCRTTRRNAR